jgi:hypothetical protein
MSYFTKEQLNAMTKSQAIANIGNVIYEASSLFEQLEGYGKCIGNGHHIRQEVSEFAQKLMSDRFKENL